MQPARRFKYVKKETREILRPFNHPVLTPQVTWTVASWQTEQLAVFSWCLVTAEKWTGFNFVVLFPKLFLWPHRKHFHCHFPHSLQSALQPQCLLWSPVTTWKEASQWRNLDSPISCYAAASLCRLAALFGGTIRKAIWNAWKTKAVVLITSCLTIAFPETNC